MGLGWGRGCTVVLTVGFFVLPEACLAVEAPLVVEAFLVLDLFFVLDVFLVAEVVALSSALVRLN